MGYIVNLMVILDDIFRTTSGDIFISQENILLVIERHEGSNHSLRIHRDIREFVTAFTDKFSVLQRDLILERIIDLIQKYFPPSTRVS